MKKKLKMKRSAGILLPVFSLPGKNRIGCFSREAYEFVDFLKEAGQRYWQVLPLGPTGYGDSPYQSFSTFAGNPYFIDPETLCKEGLLTRKELQESETGETASAPGKDIDYDALYRIRFRTLRLAFSRAGNYRKKDRERFAEKNRDWLPDYSLFMALKDAHGGKSFFQWEKPLVRRNPEALKEAREKYASDCAFYEFLQYEFRREWRALKKYANEKGIGIIGDLPIYTACDSADFWGRQELFRTDPEGFPVAVAGCPPDAFAETGQLWGNPLYDWEVHRKEGFAWWIRRIGYQLELFDLLRIDHFRGFESFYVIPYGEATAVNGHWEKGPGMTLFRAVEKKLGKLPLIAEDLGFLTPQVRKLLKDSGFPGMKVLQFAFSGPDSGYLIHMHPKNSIVYTGTHDNPPTCAWAEELSGGERMFFLEYFGLSGDVSPGEICRLLVREALASPAKCAIIPIQDYLALGKESRINTPSTLGDNWLWRLPEEELTSALARRLKRQARVFGRFHKKKK